MTTRNLLGIRLPLSRSEQPAILTSMPNGKSVPPIKYTITYNANGGVMPTNYPKNYTDQDTEPTVYLFRPVRIQFLGMVLIAGFSGRSDFRNRSRLDWRQSSLCRMGRNHSGRNLHHNLRLERVFGVIRRRTKCSPTY